MPDGELDAAVDDLVRRATRGSAASKALGKRAFYAQIDLDQARAYEYATHVMAAGATTAASFTQSGGTFAGTGAMAFADFTQTAGTTHVGGDFTVSNSYAQTNLGVINVGGNVSITHTAGPLVMGNLSTTGNLSLTSLTGPISQAAGSALVTQAEPRVAVLNAGDARIAGLAPLCDGSVILYASDDSVAALAAHRATG